MPVSIKCEIKIKSGIFASVLIGLLSASVIYGLVHYLTLSYLQLFFIEASLIVGLALAIGAYKFYRDPERIPPKDMHAIVSPADGRVIYIKEVSSGQVPFSVKGNNKYQLEELTNTNLLDNALYTIGIAMTILDVHVNRTPINGKVVSIKHTPGKFISLKKEQSVIKNERLTTVVDQGTFKIGVVQIASRLIRRIQSYLKEGQLVECGQRLGMIRFGSQVDLIIPNIENLKIRVSLGEEVKAGVSVIAQYSLP